MKIAAVIPARYHATRLPGKPLADIAGNPMIRWVYERTRKARSIDEVWVATDDERIHAAVKRFGGNCRMTSPEHQSGTDRLAEVVKKTQWDIVVNVQGDEPLIDPAMIDAVVTCFQEDASIHMSTLKRRIRSADEIANPDVVKVVTNIHDNALYFSRSPLPFFRDGWKNLSAVGGGSLLFPVFKHIGLYGYRRDFLLTFAELKPTPLEKIEHLEQLRALENGYTIRVKTTEIDTVSVDSPEDLTRVRRLVETNGLSCAL
ncbi:MAG: 3-deoxy-manno-octulosonate cytidylyltransferase [Deltaproteobacteria bacterium]|nr:3-deoxy-manno-octulosonate cytidylyltransferase [Deltaproteobacteria bacterium]